MIVAIPTIFCVTAVFGFDINRSIELNNEGVVALNKGLYNLAIKKLSDSLVIDPNYQLGIENLATAYNKRGIYLFKKASYEEAFHDFDRSFKLNRSQNTRTNRCITSLMLKKFENGYEDAARLDSQVLKGLAEIGLNQIDEGIRVLKLVEPPNMLSNIGLCIAYEKQGKTALSRSYRSKLKKPAELTELALWKRALVQNR